MMAPQQTPVSKHEDEDIRALCQLLLEGKIQLPDTVPCTTDTVLAEIMAAFNEQGIRMVLIKDGSAPAAKLPEQKRRLDERVAE